MFRNSKSKKWSWYSLQSRKCK